MRSVSPRPGGLAFLLPLALLALGSMPQRPRAVVHREGAVRESWEDVAGRVFGRGVAWIERRRRTWPAGPGDPWRRLEGLDCSHPALNPLGREVGDEKREVLDDLLRAYDARLVERGDELWDAVRVAYRARVHAGGHVPEPDPWHGLDDLGVFALDGVPGADGQALWVPARGFGWRVDLRFGFAEYPELGRLMGEIEKLRRLRIDALRAAIASF